MIGIIGGEDLPRRALWLRLGALGVAACVPFRGAQAAGIEIAPVITELMPSQMTTTIQISNRSPQMVSLQARAFDWDQDLSKETLVESTVLLVSPPIFQVQAGQTQTLRIVLRQPPPKPEGTYRILLDELPGGGGGQTQVQFSVRMSLPVFAYTQVGLQPTLRWTLEGTTLLVENVGNRHIRLSELSLSDPRGRAYRLTGPETPYVLPGKRREWRLERPVPPGALKLTGISEAGRFEADLSSSSR